MIHDDDDDDDDALLRRELGDDYEAQREHWGGDYHEPEPESETELVAARVAELENLVDVGEENRARAEAGRGSRRREERASRDEGGAGGVGGRERDARGARGLV